MLDKRHQPHCRGSFHVHAQAGVMRNEPQKMISKNSYAGKFSPPIRTEPPLRCFHIKNSTKIFIIPAIKLDQDIMTSCCIMIKTPFFSIFCDIIIYVESFCHNLTACYRIMI